MATDYSRHVFKELERANAEIENLKGKVIPELKNTKSLSQEQQKKMEGDLILKLLKRILS